jgi:MoaA/NifB/PqqE/SkfB family radical SAM enzyme
MFFLAPSFAVRRHDGGLGVLDLRARTEVDVQGSLATDVFDAPHRAAERLRMLAALDPALAPIADAVGSSGLRPWSRATLLEGSGYERLFIELTARCNERCIHCYAESSPERTESLALREVLDVLAAGKRLGFSSVQLTGGDPLIAETCVPAAARAVELGFGQVEIYTNGLALKGDVFRSLCDLRVAFAFSFYSHRPEAHDAITGVPGSQARTLDAIRRCARAGLETRASVILQDANAHDLEPTLALLEDAGVPRARIGVDGVRTAGRGSYFAEASHGLSARHDGGRPAEARGFGGTLAVLPDGAVVPCVFQRGTVLGNVRARGLEAIAREEQPLPFPTLPEPSEEGVRAERLGCRECRLRDHLLASTLVALRRKATA